MNYKRITVNTLASISIVLSIILAIALFAVCVNSDPFYAAEHWGSKLIEIRSDLAYWEDVLTEAESTLSKEEAKLIPLEKERKAGEKALETANDNLDEVCSRSYYSAYLCEKDANCEGLHKKVSNASTTLSSVKSKISACENEIEESTEIIEKATEYIYDIEDDIDHATAKRTEAVLNGLFFVFAMLLSMVGFVLFAKYLAAREDKRFGILACALLAVSSLVFLFLSTTPTFIYFLGLIIFVCIYLLIAEKISARIAARVITIIASIILFALAAIFEPFTALVFVVNMILISLILAPCVYTEYLDIAEHIFYTIITLGIWHLIWMYNTTENLNNKVEKVETRAPIRELLLCAFLPLYYIFWTYKTAENTEVYGEEKGIKFEIGILCLALSVICPLLASIIIQDKTNVIVGKPVFEAPAPVAEAPSPQEAPENAEAVTEA